MFALFLGYFLGFLWWDLGFWVWGYVGLLVLRAFGCFLVFVLFCVSGFGLEVWFAWVCGWYVLVWGGVLMCFRCLVVFDGV